MPILVYVDWGYWVMVDYTFGDYAVVCDPWDPRVHVTGGSVPYNNRTPVLSWSVPV